MDKNTSKIAKIAFVALTLWVLWAIVGFFLLRGGIDKVGLFGDFFGGFNALVSVVGFCAVL